MSTNIKKMRKALQRGDCNLDALPYEKLSPRNRRKLVRLSIELTKQPDKKPTYDTEALVSEMEENENIHSEVH